MDIPALPWLTSLLGVMLALLPVGRSIDCYKCTSVDHNNPNCEDDPHFKTDLTTIDFIARKCSADLFYGTHCFKLKGVKPDGTTITVRDCSIGDWGSHCGDIKYANEGEAEMRITGCLEACDHDGCNAAVRGSAALGWTLGAAMVAVGVRWWL